MSAAAGYMWDNDRNEAAAETPSGAMPVTPANEELEELKALARLGIVRLGSDEPINTQLLQAGPGGPRVGVLAALLRERDT